MLHICLLSRYPPTCDFASCTSKDRGKTGSGIAMCRRWNGGCFVCGAVLAHEAVLLSLLIKIITIYLKQTAWEVFGILSDVVLCILEVQ